MTAYAEMVRMHTDGKVPVAIPITHDSDQAVWITGFDVPVTEDTFAHPSPTIRACTLIALAAHVHDRAASCHDVT